MKYLKLPRAGEHAMICTYVTCQRINKGFSFSINATLHLCLQIFGLGGLDKPYQLFSVISALSYGSVFALHEAGLGS